MFTFTQLGADGSAASQSLLELDGGVKVLVDVGWDASFDVDTLLQSLEKHVSTLSIILLTHPNLEHIGAFAHCCKHLPLFARIPVYATTPVINLGRALLSDLYASAPLASSTVSTASITASPVLEDGTTDPTSLLLQPPSLTEIATYFALINPLKYSQPHQPIPSPFSPSLGGLTVTAYNAGHTLGGTIWHIQHGLESLVYAADWNQGRENLLAGASWLSSATGGAEIIEPLRRPTALICSSRGIEKLNSLPRKKRDDTLISLIRETIAQGGKVLLPTDSSARVLELAFILNQTWSENVDGPHADTYKNARIYMASKSSTSSVRYLQSMLEWVDESVRGEVEAAMTKGKGQGNITNPLEWKHVKQIERKSQVERALARGKPSVMLASDASLEWGFSKQALQALSADPRNLVILTEQVGRLSQTRSGVGRQLLHLWRDQQGQVSAQSGAKVVDADGASVELRDASTVSLSADESALYQTYLARHRQMHSTLTGDNAVTDATTADAVDDQASESSDSDEEDEDAEHQGRALNISAQLTQNSKRKVAGAVGLTDAELGVNVLLRSKSVHDYDVRSKRGREKMYPFVAQRHRSDEYGDTIKPEDFLRAEERDDVDGVDMREGMKQDTSVGQKRKWGDSSNTTGGPNGRRGSKPHNKRVKIEKLSGGHAPDDIDAAIARATGQTGTSGANGAADGDEESEDSEESDYEPEDHEAPFSPQKVVFSTRQLTLRLRIAHVDFSGLHEKRDLQMLIPLIRPRKLILLPGDGGETQKLAEEFSQLLATESAGDVVFAPGTGQAVDASVDTNAWTLKLSRQLVKKLTWQNVKGLGVVALTGRLEAERMDPEAADSKAEEDSPSKKKKLKLSKADSTSREPPSQAPEKAFPVLDLLQTASSTNTQQHNVTQPVHVGDLRLADLRRLMHDSGHTADFRGEGTLLIDGTVVVRKSASGRLEIESGAGGVGMPQWRTRDHVGSFYAVRQAVYAGLAVVAAV